MFIKKVSLHANKASHPSLSWSNKEELETYRLEASCKNHIDYIDHLSYVNYMIKKKNRVKKVKFMRKSLFFVFVFLTFYQKQFASFFFLLLFLHFL